MVTCTFNASTQKAAAKGSKIRGQPGLHSNFQPSLGYSYHKDLVSGNKKEKEKRKKNSKAIKMSGRKTEKHNEEDWCCRSVVKHLPSMRKVLEVYQEHFMN